MNKWTKPLQIMETLLESVGYLCIIFSTLLVFVAVIMRYIFGVSIAWVEELSKVAVLAMVFLTAGILALRDEHMKFTFVSNRFKGKFAACVNLFSLIVCCVICALLAVGSFYLVFDEAETGVLTESGIFHLWWFHLFMLVGFVIFTFSYLYLLIALLLTLIYKGDAA